MDKQKESKSHFIDDQGLIVSNKERNTAFFVTLCRILTVAMIILGAIALIVGNMNI